MNLSEEDRVVCILASLPECYNTLVTALEANPAVPALAVVSERLLHEESKMKNRLTEPSQEDALAAKFKRFPFKCHSVTSLVISKGSMLRSRGQVKPLQEKKKSKPGAAFKVTIAAEDDVSLDYDSTGLIVQHALSANESARINGYWHQGPLSYVQL